MKKRSFKPVIIILIVFIVLFFPIMFVPYMSFRCDPSMGHDVNMTFENAPEGTAYIEPLISMDSSDKLYKDSDSDTEIAKYTEDGYVSLYYHYIGAEKTYYYKEDDESVLFLARHIDDEYAYNMHDFYKRYKIKAAYVDEDGKVLGTTNPAMRIYAFNSHYCRLIADGESLTLSVDELPPVAIAILYIGIYGEPIAIVALIVFIILAVKQDNSLPNLDGRKA